MNRGERCRARRCRLVDIAAAELELSRPARVRLIGPHFSFMPPVGRPITFSSAASAAFVVSDFPGSCVDDSLFSQLPEPLVSDHLLQIGGLVEQRLTASVHSTPFLSGGMESVLRLPSPRARTADQFVGDGAGAVTLPPERQVGQDRDILFQSARSFQALVLANSLRSSCRIRACSRRSRLMKRR